MKRYWAVLLTAVTLASCRTAQPTTNPFLRTTVPPPSATPGVMVTPGQPYAQGISPPLVTQPAPVITTPAPVTTQPVPVMPPPAAPMTAPPNVAPQGDQFKAPGGSYLFHQSSNDPPPPQPLDTAPAVASTGEVQLASLAEPAELPRQQAATATPQYAVSQATYVEPGPVHVSGPMDASPIIENPYVKADPAPGELPEPTAFPMAQSPPAPSRPTTTRPTASHPASVPPAKLTVQPQPRQPAPSAMPLTTAGQPSTSGPSTPVARLSVGDQSDRPNTPSSVAISSQSSSNGLRILGESSPPTASSLTAGTRSSQVAIAPPQTPPSNTGSVMRITAGTSTPAIRSTVEAAPASSNMTITTAPVGSTVPRIISSNSDTQQNVIQTSFQPAGSASTISIAPSSR